MVLSKKTKKIAVFLPIAYKGGSLKGAKNVAKMFYLGSRQAGEPVDVVFSCVADAYDIDKEFSDLRALGITVRETTWRVLTPEDAQIAWSLSATKRVLRKDSYSAPWDGINSFLDCDFWFVISDRLAPSLLPIKPYAVLAYDFIQRYVPEIFHYLATYDNENDIFNNLHDAEHVFVTTPKTRMDAIQYVGLAETKVSLLPMEFSFEKSAVKSIAKVEPYFIWVTNSSYHKNHYRAFEALAAYYNKYDGKLKVHIVGFGIKRFMNDPGPYAFWTKIKTFFESIPCFKKNIVIHDYLDDDSYTHLIANAKFLFHPVIYDNGTFAVLEAACYGVPSISSNYPQMLYMNENFELNMKFFSPFSTEEMATALDEMENNYFFHKKQLPSQERLTFSSYENKAKEFWHIVKGAL